ncbi:hypothetical protein NUU61_007714 [Penicillium alfredii]|uniref:Uncharacterized protein n=1 Tax=Penicillium alfredii TaxID=1506179 RepID=A0A9W9ER10_9EURO|nr:uncharacterized protein NUU61_007714 [Penicillium alfredii]KAJ5086407.1 hypothetical protein NUU61_007714 [Penicillium alfredii]
MDQEEAPPPYSAVDPLLAEASNRNGNSHPVPRPLRGNVPESQYASSSRIAEQPTVVPTHFSSAEAYFEERPLPALDESRALLPHHMTIYPRSQAKDFPRRPRCWGSRMDVIAQQDWDAFLQYMFPAQLGLAASSQHLPRQLRAEIQRDRKDRPQETDEERRARIAAVISEWNQDFFEPRAICIVFVYVSELDTAPISALCPRCYPAATKATQSPGISGFVESQPAHAQSTISPVFGQPAPSPSPWSVPPMHPFANPHAPPMPFGAPFRAPTYHVPGASPTNPPQYYPYPPPPPPGVPPWQWNNWAYAQSQYSNSGTSKGGTFGWISQLANQAQKYGERFSEQAQIYGDQLSAHANHYSRQVEERALAHGRWLEEQAGLHGRKAGFFNPRPPWDPYSAPAGVPYAAPIAPVQQNPSPVDRPESRTQPTTQTNPQPSDNKPPVERSAERPRRASISSVSSESSLSSIDSLSTTSDLSASDLANVRTQLQSLDDRHDRTLYDAAVDLRRQLSVLQESRRESRFGGRQNWRNAWRQNQHHQQYQRPDHDDWGRWESPEQQQRNSTERRAMKEEMRATRKAFRDVLRRAREEQREQRRARRNRRRLERQNTAEEPPLDRRMGQLALENPQRPLPTLEPASRTSHPQGPSALPAASGPSDASSDFSAAPSTSGSASQSSMHDPQAGSAADKKGKPLDAPGRFREMLKQRKAKKQQQQQQPSDPASDAETQNNKATTKKEPGAP